MNGLIDDITQKLNGLSDDVQKIQAENEALRKENAELKKQLAKLKAKESKSENKARKFDGIDLEAEDSCLKMIVKQKLEEMKTGIINHTSLNEENDVAEILHCWKSNNNAGRMPMRVLKELICSQQLSDASIGIIFNEIKNENDAVLNSEDEAKNMPRKYCSLIENLSLSKKISGEKAETLLEIYINNFCRLVENGDREVFGASGFYDIAQSSKKFTITNGTREDFFVRKS